MKIKNGFILREIAGKQVAVPTQEDLDLNMMITLNATGSFLWKMLETGAEMDELADALAAKFDVDHATAEAHAAAFVEKLKANDFLA